jgi:phage antirepressor YoqD-like protein
MKNLALATKNKTMTLKEITDLLEVRHNDAMVTVAKMAESPEFGDATKSSYRTKMGNNYETYELSHRQSIAVSAKLNTPMLMRVIDRWQELETAQYKIPSSFAEALKLAGEIQESLDTANLQIEQDKPKVDFAMAVRNMQGACSVGDFAKTIGIGRNRLFKLMRDDGVLMKNNLPYQKYCENDCFVVNEQIPYTDSNGKTHPAFTTMVTGKGQVFLEKKYRKAA